MNTYQNCKYIVACLLTASVATGCVAETTMQQVSGDAPEAPLDGESNSVNEVVDTSILSNENILTPEQTRGTTSFSSLGYNAVAAGEYHTLAVRNDGKVFATGNNYDGQLGNGTRTSTYANAPTQVAGISNVTSVAAGCYHSLALTSTGSVWAWGSSAKGQVGTGTTIRQLYPVQLSSLPTIKAIAAGCLHSLAIDIYGHVWAWGSNSWGQVGNGSYTNALLPVMLPNLTATAVDGGENFSLALQTDGIVMAWGNNSYGQLARGNTISSTTPVVTQLAGISAISAGANHGLAAQGTDLLVWGDNIYGELGIGSTTPSFSSTPILSSVDWWYVVSPAAGRWFSLVGSYDGFGPYPPGPFVSSWGYNASGQLGKGTTASTSQVSWPHAQYSDGSGLFLEGWPASVALSAGGYHAVAIDWQGQVVAWGRNDLGQLGNGSTTNSVNVSATLFP